MAVLTVYADAADGEIDSYGDDNGGGGYAGARAGTGYSGSVQAWPTSGQGTVGQNATFENTGDPDFIDYTAYTVMETFLSFDTSSIGDTDTVSAATLTVTAASDNSTQDFTMQARLRDWGATLEAADYVAGASLSALTLLATYASSGGFTSNTAYGLTDVALPANINKTGSTRMLLHSDRTSGNNTPSGAEYLVFYSADASGTTNDPKIVAVYSGGASAQDVTLSLLDAGAALYAPTVAAKSLLTLSLLDAGAALYAPTVANDRYDSLYPPTLTQVTGSQTITVPLLDSVAALFDPTVFSDQFVSVPLLDAGAALYAPSLVSKNLLSLGLLDAGAALYAPSLGHTIALAFLSRTTTLYAPTLTTGATLSLTLLDASPALFAPTVAAKSTLVLGLLDAAPALYAPTVIRDQFVTVPLLDAAAALYAPSLSGKNLLALDLLDAGGALYAPVVVVLGPQSLSLVLLDGGAALYGPALATTLRVGGDLLEMKGGPHRRRYPQAYRGLRSV